VYIINGSICMCIHHVSYYTYVYVYLYQKQAGWVEVSGMFIKGTWGRRGHIHLVAILAQDELVPYFKISPMGHSSFLSLSMASEFANTAWAFAMLFAGAREHCMGICYVVCRSSPTQHGPLLRVHGSSPTQHGHLLYCFWELASTA